MAFLPTVVIERLSRLVADRGFETLVLCVRACARS
jgi:hypothetical protein